MVMIDEHSEDKGEDRNICQHHSDREHSKLHLHVTVIQHPRRKQDKEIQRTITVGWTVFAKHCNAMRLL